MRRVVPKAGAVRKIWVDTGHKWCATVLYALASSWLCWWGAPARIAVAMVEVVAEHSLCGCRMARLSSWLAAVVALTGVTMAELRT